MDSIIVNSTTVEGERGGIFTVQVGATMRREFSRVFVAKTLEEVDTETGDKVVQIASHLLDEVFKTSIGKWIVDGEIFTDSALLCSKLNDVVWERIRIVGDEVTGATVNGDEVAKEYGILQLEEIAKTSDIQTLNHQLEVVSTELGGVRGQVANNSSDIEGIQQQLTNRDHFRGFYATTAEIQALVDSRHGDYAYNVETGTKWVYNGTSWEDSLDPIPNQTVEPSDTIPLVDGAASTGSEERYARGDHRHPTDSTAIAGAAIGSITIPKSDRILQLPTSYPNAELLNGKSINEFATAAIRIPDGSNMLTYFSDKPSGFYSADSNEKIVNGVPGEISTFSYDVNVLNTFSWTILAKSYSTGRTYYAVVNTGKLIGGWKYIADGGNADTIDGKHASDFLQTLGYENLNIDTVAMEGKYRIGADTAGTFPANVIKQGSHLLFYKWDDNAAYQLYFEHTKKTCWMREKIGSAWKSWGDMSAGRDNGSLPNGDGSATYWASLKNGLYYAASNILTNQPTSYGIVHVCNVVNPSGNTEGFILWQSLPTGGLYGMSHSGAAISVWNEYSYRPQITVSNIAPANPQDGDWWIKQ